MDIPIDQIMNLPIIDKLHLVEALWDNIGASGEPLVLSETQKAELQQRAAELEADPSLGITREELWKRV